MYSVPQNQQLIIFLCSLGVGFLLGVLYDILRTLRLTLTKSKIALIIFDIIYFILFGFFTFLFILAMNKGEVRSYIIIGEIIGGIFYYFSFGIAAIRITDVTVRFIRKTFSFIFKLITAPFRLIFKLFSRLFGKISVLFKKTGKKFEKIRKKLLPKARLYVYNLFGILSVRRNQPKKGGNGFGKGNKKEKDASL